MSGKDSNTSDSVTPARLASAALLTGLAAGALLGASSGAPASNEASSIQQQFQTAFAPGVHGPSPIGAVVVRVG